MRNQHQRPIRMIARLGFPGAVLALLLGGCESSSLSPPDSPVRPPTIGVPALSPVEVNIDSLPATNGAVEIAMDLRTPAGDPDGLSSLRTVRTEIFRPRAADPFLTVTLADDGRSPDSSAGDGVFSARTTFTARRDQAGLYRVRFSATDVNGLRSTAVDLATLLTRNNSRPGLFDSTLSAPDTVDRPATGSGSFFMSIAAADADGLADIRSVFLQNLSSLGRDALLDDGGAASGDRIAGDGIFSRIFQVPSTVPPGTYLFRLLAVDTFGDTSAPVPYALVVR